MARTASEKQQTKTLEQRLWDAADALRGNQETSEYKHVILGLVFLEYISDHFEEWHLAIDVAVSIPGSPEFILNLKRRTQLVEDCDECTSHNVFWASGRARWQSIKNRTNLPGIGQDIDNAKDLIKEDSPLVSGVLLRNYGREKARRTVFQGVGTVCL